MTQNIPQSTQTAPSLPAQVLDDGPWYRQRWTWYLMLGPGVVVLASMVTLWLAIRSSDGLVTDDYYRKGLAVNNSVHASALATQLGLRAYIRLTEQDIRVRLETQAGAEFAAPERLRVTLSHPTRAGLDQTALLQAVSSGQREYVGILRLPHSGHWLMLVEDEAQRWRLLGDTLLPAAGEVVVDSRVTTTTANKGAPPARSSAAASP